MATKETELMPARVRDPFALLREFTSDLDRTFDRPFLSGFRWPLLRAFDVPGVNWFPDVDIFTRDNRLFARVDLPGMKAGDVKVEVTGGQLAISGERRTDREEHTDHVYRRERSYGKFSRTVPLPEGVAPADVKATFVDGVLEVSVPVPATAQPATHRVAIEEAPKIATAASAA